MENYMKTRKFDDSFKLTIDVVGSSLDQFNQ